MKRFIPIVLVGILICTAFGAAALPNTNTNKISEKNLGRDYTHTVFVEVGTAQWCPPCATWNTNIYNAYNSYAYDFEYVEMIYDDHNSNILNTLAYNWLNLYGISSIPTSICDGDYRRIVGNAPSQIPTAFNACGSRTVKNIVGSVSLTWLGSATMTINIQIHNNEATQYNGYIRVPIAEIISRYTTQSGTQYHHGFLDYAFPMNTAISIPAGGTYTNSVTWNGSQHHDNQNTYFSDITSGNIIVMMGVFNSDTHYIDETAAATMAPQVPPNTPNTPTPSNGQTNIPLNKVLSWYGDDPNPQDTVTYNVYFGTSNPPPLQVTNQSGTTYTPASLNFLTTYYWKIVAWDNHGASATGPVWQFTTRGQDPPNTPSNPNPANGSTNIPINKVLTWSGGDPNGDVVKYDVYFGLTNPPMKVSSNQSTASYTPGTMNQNTTYYWKIVSWDSFGATTAGPIWQFKTSEAVNYPPYTPTITGPVKGKIAVDYPFNFTSTDPDANQIFFYVEWGDNTSTDWLGPFDSGHVLTISHQWSEKGTYPIRAKVKDIHGLESDWRTYQVIMPKNLGIHTYPFLQWLFEHFPHGFPLLRLLFEN